MYHKSKCNKEVIQSDTTKYGCFSKAFALLERKSELQAF